MNQKRLQIVLLSLSLPLLAYLSFFVPREEIFAFWAVMGGLFVMYGGLLWADNDSPTNFYVASGGLLRLIPLFSLPLLSDDYFRFVWDGRLMAQGVNPFLQTPREFLQDPEMMKNLGLSMELFEGMNSPDFFTIYPPVLQGIFWLANVISPHSIAGAVLVMKLFLFMGEIGSLILIGKLLKSFQKLGKWLAFYAWNPLVIIEIVGNVHFEGLMIFFLLLMIYLLQKKKIWLSILPFVLAINCKLLPLMFGPLLIRRLGWGKSIIYGLATAFLTLLLFLTILDAQTFSHMLESVELYFANFEFNASIWYLIREGFGHLSKDNLLEIVGKYLGLATIIGILLLSFFEKKPDTNNLPKSMMWALGIYLLFSPIVHPWYVIPLLALATMGRFRFALVWTVLLPLTYFTYSVQPYEENLWLVLFEYLLVGTYLIWEMARGKRKAGE